MEAYMAWILVCFGCFVTGFFIAALVAGERANNLIDRIIELERELAAAYKRRV